VAPVAQPCEIGATIMHIYEYLSALRWGDIALVVSALFLGLTWFVARQQLTSLNKATKLQNFIALAQEMDSTNFSRAYSFVSRLRNKSLTDKRRDLLADANTDDPHFDRVTNYMERVAYLANHGILDSTMTMDWWGVVASEIYTSIGDYIEDQQRTDPGFCSEITKFVRNVKIYWNKVGKTSAR
jgi:hypothetical protein